MKIDLAHIIPVLRDVLEDDTLQFTKQSRAIDYTAWTSVVHIYIVSSIEKKFKVRFTTYQILAWKCVGDILKDLNEGVGE